MSDTVLIIGGDGIIGRALVSYFLKKNHPIISTTRQSAGVRKDCIFLDLEKPELWQIPPVVQSAVLCAAVTDLSYCRNNFDLAKKINVDNIFLLARELNNRGAFVTFLSTNLVFDGTTPKTSPTAHMNPKTIYGKFKATTELLFEDISERSAIIRLTKVFYRDIMILNYWKKCLNSGTTILPFSDYRCAPIDIDTTVKGIAQITLNNLSGIWQFSPDYDVTYSDIAIEIARRNEVDLALVKPVLSTTLNKFENVPMYTSLDASRCRSELSLDFIDMPAVLDHIYDL